MSKARNKVYWKNVKTFQKQKVFKQKPSEQVKTFSQYKTLFKISPLKSKMIFKRANPMFTNQFEHQLFKDKEMKILYKTNVQGVLFQILKVKIFLKTNFKEMLFNVMSKEISINFKVKISFSQGQKVFLRTSVGYNKQCQNRFHNSPNPSVSKQSFPKQNFEKLEVKGKKLEPFKLTKPHFPNSESKQKFKASLFKGRNNVKNINYWLEGKGKKYQQGKFSEEQIKYSYESYLNESQNGSSSSLESNPSVKRRKEIPKKKVDSKRTVCGKGKVIVELKPLNDYILMPNSVEVD